MTQDNVVKLIQPAEFSDPLTEVLREGARALLAQAVEAEVAAFLGSHADEQTEDGRQRLVRHGHRPEPAVVCTSRTAQSCRLIPRPLRTEILLSRSLLTPPTPHSN